MAVRSRKTRGTHVSDVQARYDAAGNGRRARGWTPPSSGPNIATQGNEKIRNRPRDAVRNDWGGESGVQKWTTNLIGVGIVPRWNSQSIADLWTEFVKQADADCVLDFYGLQTLGTRSWLASGEVFLRRRSRRLNSGLAVPMQVQLLEADFCPVFDALAWPGMPAGNSIRQGIEFDKNGTRVAYWFWPNHPGERQITSDFNTVLVRVTADNVRHLFEPLRPGQIRGVSMLAPVLMRLRGTGDFEDTVLDRQKLANLFVTFITRQMPQDWQGINTDPDTGLPTFYDNDGSPMAGLEPGIQKELLPGEDVKFANPPGAGVEHASYLRSTNLGSAAGQGLPYELWAGDIKDVSDRTLRVLMNEFHRFAEQRQWQILIPQFCQGAVEWFVAAGALAGKIALSRLKEARNPEWAPHGWDYLHPVQDVQGKILAIQNGLTSKTREITRRGDDPRKIVDERRLDAEAEKAAGLTPPAPLTPQQRGKPPAAPKPQAPSAMAEMLAAFTSQAAQQNALMLKMIEVMGAPQPQAVQQPQAAAPAPAFTIHNHIPEAGQIVVPAPLVTVAAAEVNVPAPIVNVTGGEVNVTTPAPIVNVENIVQPAEVNVNLPDRKTESTITRDREGNITNVVQTERDLH